MKKYILWGIILFIISLIIGYYYGQTFFLTSGINLEKEDKLQEDTITENIVIETSYEEIKILPSTKLGLKKTYKGCDHTSFEFVELPSELVNKTKAEVEQFYKEWEIEEFYENKVILTKEVEGICEEHFVITIGDEFVEIFRVIDKEKNTMLYNTTDISKEYLTKEDLEKLEEGISIYRKDQLNAILEDFE